ncbi:MAG: hypothetical protein NT062_33825 [Proteobacteria bacterium]|nr:hypothetical protein [Pseudomonadota bacterium]
MTLQATAIELTVMDTSKSRLANIATRHARDWMTALTLALATMTTAGLALAAL